MEITKQEVRGIESDAKARAPRKARHGLPEAVRRGNRMPRGKTGF
jgi:hypothetical protein